MKKLVGLIGCFALCGCALGLVDEVEQTLDEIETTLDDLHTAECIRGCTDVGEVCLEYANGECIDNCELDKDDCDAQEDACLSTESAACDSYTDQQYSQCMDAVHEYCDQDCDGQENDCNQDCAQYAEDCLTTNADCVADCVEELENSLKDLELNK